jgi:hypothetical protein
MSGRGLMSLPLRDFLDHHWMHDWWTGVRRLVPGLPRDHLQRHTIPKTHEKNQEGVILYTFNVSLSS